VAFTHAPAYLFQNDTPAPLERTDADTLVSHPITLLSTLLVLFFCIDIVVSFFVGYFDDTGALVTDLRRSALTYATCAGGGLFLGVFVFFVARCAVLCVCCAALQDAQGMQALNRLSLSTIHHTATPPHHHQQRSGRLKWDLLTTLPFDTIVLAALNGPECDTATAQYVMLLSLLKLVRPALVGGCDCPLWPLCFALLIGVNGMPKPRRQHPNQKQSKPSNQNNTKGPHVPPVPDVPPLHVQPVAVAAGHHAAAQPGLRHLPLALVRARLVYLGGGGGVGWCDKRLAGFEFWLITKTLDQNNTPKTQQTPHPKGPRAPTFSSAAAPATWGPRRGLGRTPSWPR
jgi:hypothetical protein